MITKAALFSFKQCHSSAGKLFKTQSKFYCRGKFNFLGVLFHSTEAQSNVNADDLSTDITDPKLG